MGGFSCRWRLSSVAFHLDPQEFATPDSSKKLDCKGRPCAKCQKCRDWHFNGDQKTWNWLCNFKNWDKNDRDRWRRDYRELFTKRNGATCYDAYYDDFDYYDDYYHDLYHHLCLCEKH